MEIDGGGDGDGAKWACLCGPSGERGQERGLASMPPQSEAVAATEVAVMMGAVIAATAALNGGRLTRAHSAAKLYPKPPRALHPHA